MVEMELVGDMDSQKDFHDSFSALEKVRLAIASSFLYAMKLLWLKERRSWERELVFSHGLPYRSCHSIKEMGPLFSIV